MTKVGAGGVVIRTLTFGRTFQRDFGKLSEQYQTKLKARLNDLKKDPRPPGLRFEKLKGYKAPTIYSCHIDGNYKFTFEIDGDAAVMRRVGPHDDIDRTP